MTPHEILVQTRARLSRPELWMKYYFFGPGDAEGNPVVAACLIGGVGQSVGAIVPTNNVVRKNRVYVGSEDGVAQFADYLFYTKSGGHSKLARTKGVRAAILALYCAIWPEFAEIARKRSTVNLLTSVEVWNDQMSRTHAEVLAALDRAIASIAPAQVPVASDAGSPTTAKEMIPA